MRFVVLRKSSSDSYEKIAYQVAPAQWHVLDRKKGFSTAAFVRQPASGLCVDIPRLVWKHAEDFEETQALHFYFQQYNSGFNEHLLTVSAFDAEFRITPTQLFLHYLHTAGTGD